MAEIAATIFSNDCVYDQGLNVTGHSSAVPLQKQGRAYRGLSENSPRVYAF